MDPLSITATSIAIATLCGQCGNCVVSLIKWKDQIKSIDATIMGFCDELRSLEQSLASLEGVLNTDPMREVARIAASNDSKVLWLQIERSMSDVRKALTSLERVLERIRRAPNGLFRKPVLQFRTSLESGEIASLRQRLILLGSTLNLPLQMLSIFMQAENASANDQTERLDSLTRIVSNIQSTLEGRRRTQTSHVSDETAMYTNVTQLLSSVRGFASNASTISSAGSTTPTVTGIQRALPMRYAAESLMGENLGSEKNANIARWIPVPRATSHTSPLEETLSRQSLSLSSPDDEKSSSNTSWSQNHLAASLEEDDLDLTILEMRLSKGQHLFHVGRFADAIPFFTKSLESMNESSFKSKTTLTVDDVHLILARIYVKMERLDDAERLLGPLSDNDAPSDTLVLLAARHLLAEIWTKQEQLDRARTICLETARRRQKLLGTSSTLFRESATLLIQIYKSQGDKDEAELWEDLLLSPQLQKFIQMAKQIDRIRAQGESDKVADLAMEFLKTYPIDRFWVSKSKKKELWTDKMPELRENVLKSSGAGLAGCGYGFAPLHLLAASSSDCAAEVQYLIDCGIDINCTWGFGPGDDRLDPRFDGITPLMIATLFNNNIVANVLLKNGANIHLRDSTKKTALHWACAGLKGSTNMANILLENGANIEARDKGGWTPLLFAAWTHQTALFNLLTASGANQEAMANDGAILIHIASRAPYPALMEKLINSGADIEAKDNYGDTPLCMAIEQGREENVKTLLQRGAGVKMLNYESRSILHIAANKGHLNIVELLLKFAYESPEMDLTSWVNAKDKNGGTALRHASWMGHPAVLKPLLNAGADIKVLDCDSCSVLHVAANKGHLNVVELLLKFARESLEMDMASWVNAKDKDGGTALHHAAQNGNAAALEILLEAGAGIDLKDEEGWTALQVATHCKQDEAANTLKRRGADPTPCQCKECIGKGEGKKKKKRRV